MPYVYIPSSSYGGNNPPQVGGYRGAGRLRTSRGGALTIAQEQERQRQVALAREKHLLEVEKVRAERAALAQKQKEAKPAAAPTAEKPAPVPMRLPSSEDQRRAREAGQGYRDAEGKLSEAYRSQPPEPTADRRYDDVESMRANRTTAQPPAPAAPPAEAAKPAPSQTYDPNKDKPLVDVYGGLEGPSRAAITTYLNAQLRPQSSKPQQEAFAPEAPSAPFSRVSPATRDQAVSMDPTTAPRTRLSYDQAVKSLQNKFAGVPQSPVAGGSPPMPGTGMAASPNIDPIKAAAETERKQRRRLESDAALPGAYDLINWPGWSELANLFRSPM